MSFLASSAHLLRACPAHLQLDIVHLGEHRPPLRQHPVERLGNSHKSETGGWTDFPHVQFSTPLIHPGLDIHTTFCLHPNKQ